MKLEDLQKKITPPQNWYLCVEEDSNADGLKEAVAVVYDCANLGTELLRTPTHSTPPDDRDSVDEDANNHMVYAVHCARHFQQVVEAAKEYQKAVQDSEDNCPSDDQGTLRDWKQFDRTYGRALRKAEGKLAAALKSAQEVKT